VVACVMLIKPLFLRPWSLLPLGRYALAWMFDGIGSGSEGRARVGQHAPRKQSAYRFDGRSCMISSWSCWISASRCHCFVIK
jgi:hypothetical protein